jgi:predicted Zn-dependent protease
MNCKPLSTLVMMSCGTIALIMSGCRLVGLQVPTIGDVHAERQDRHEKVVSRFERKRSGAQYQAALSRWRDGDTERCRQDLETLLRRDPQHRDARLLLTELYLLIEQPTAAESLMQGLLAESPNDAQVHHTMALVLDAVGRPNEALAQFQWATDLDPDNEIYLMSYEAATQASSAGRIVRTDSFAFVGRPDASASRSPKSRQ